MAFLSIAVGVITKFDQMDKKTIKQNEEGDNSFSYLRDDSRFSG